MLPSSDAELDALFANYRVRPEAHSAAGVTRAQRQELAAAVLWFHTHVHDPVPALDRLSFESQELLAECFVQDFALFASGSNPAGETGAARGPRRAGSSCGRRRRRCRARWTARRRRFAGS